mmetsp:Transcript_999/g.2585  ORF Transcript_999/g.2585 Transcript_999/m.2585 type:complete len:222 (+) Transcript_999:45-710(+)
MADATGSVKVRGMPISGNVIPAVMLCKTLGCGDMEMMNIMEGQHMTPEMLKINPWHQMPNMSDGDVHLGESGAIIRYIANKYGPNMYGGSDLKAKATIDWALEWASTNFSKNFGHIWYPSAGFGSAPDDQAGANAKAVENLELFATQFLCGPGKFVGGSETPTIADYVCAVRFHMCGHATVKKTTDFELPAKIQAYVDDFLTACPAKDCLQAHDGFLDSKA